MAAVWVLLELSFYALVIYTIYKVIWYLIKMHSLKRKLEGLGSSVKLERGIFDIMLGKKGVVDLTVDTPKAKYEVSVLSFISNHGRWNIEKIGNGYCAEAYRTNKIFFNAEKHSERPESVVDYRGEHRFQRTELLLEQREDPSVKQILLIYPRPEMLTYAHTRLDLLDSGSVIEGYEIMYLEDFLDTFK